MALFDNSKNVQAAKKNWLDETFEFIFCVIKKVEGEFTKQIFPKKDTLNFTTSAVIIDFS